MMVPQRNRSDTLKNEIGCDRVIVWECGYWPLWETQDMEPEDISEGELSINEEGDCDEICQRK